ncbi:hypothetical protein CLV63_10638 [Murinocardiopsis flavida]|uniref:Prevent-host-death family protein n=1 Tax=Murinocardiopsis flavida TaxID=645275 RepID=A0A2P8DLA3_9ACTN|nr:hypothetical protein [Murinocardiopsis flavida]PSK97990.1 hypothetical protein CLV63_10638 [Murinocardiopsis flavida]
MDALPEAPFSELINKPKATVARLNRTPGHALRLRRRSEADLILIQEEENSTRTAMVNTAMRFLAELMDGDHATRTAAAKAAEKVFPWIRFLPAGDVEAFLDQLAEVLRATEQLNTHAPVLQLVVDWQHTAEIHADPELLAALTRSEDGDFGPVPPPPGYER